MEPKFPTDWPDWSMQAGNSYTSLGDNATKEKCPVLAPFKVMGGRGLGSKLDFLDFDITLKPWLSSFQNGLTCPSIPHSCRDMLAHTRTFSVKCMEKLLKN